MADAFSGSNRTCLFCEGQEASHFCACADPPALFCLSCFVQHCTKFPRTIHKCVPIAALGQTDEEYKRKSDALKRAAEELRKNVARIEQCSSELEAVVQSCINFLNEYRKWWVQQLQTEKEQLSAAVEAAIREANLCFDQSVEPVSSLAQALWKLAPENLQVFGYIVSTPDIQTLCESVLRYQNDFQKVSEWFPERSPQEEVKEQELCIRGEESRDFFAAVINNSVELYDLHTQEMTKHTIPVHFGSGGSYLALGRHNLLCLGANPASTAVYDLDLSCFELTSLPPLSTRRSAAGVACTSQLVYVFGGDSLQNKSCEKYALQDKQWQALGDMKYGRASFTVCTFRTYIYLPCPLLALAIESFSPETETFTELSICLPCIMAKCYSVAFVANGELCVLTTNMQMGRWEMEREITFHGSETNRKCFSSQPPLVLGAVVLIANGRTGSVEKFSLESYTFI